MGPKGNGSGASGFQEEVTLGDSSRCTHLHSCRSLGRQTWRGRHHSHIRPWHCHMHMCKSIQGFRRGQGSVGCSSGLQAGPHFLLPAFSSSSDQNSVWAFPEFQRYSEPAGLHFAWLWARKMHGGDVFVWDLKEMSMACNTSGDVSLAWLTQGYGLISLFPG